MGSRPLYPPFRRPAIRKDPPHSVLRVPPPECVECTILRPAFNGDVIVVKVGVCRGGNVVHIAVGQMLPRVTDGPPDRPANGPLALSWYRARERGLTFRSSGPSIAVFFRLFGTVDRHPTRFTQQCAVGRVGVRRSYTHQVVIKNVVAKRKV